MAQTNDDQSESFPPTTTSWSRGGCRRPLSFLFLERRSICRRRIQRGWLFLLVLLCGLSSPSFDGLVEAAAISQYMFLSDPENTGGAVIDIQDPSDLDKTYLKGATQRVVMYYSPFCGHCQRFKSDFIRMAKRIQGTYPKAKFYGVSCVAQKDLCKQRQLASFPSFYIALPRVPMENAKVLQVGTTGLTANMILKRLNLDPLPEEEEDTNAEPAGTAAEGGSETSDARNLPLELQMEAIVDTEDNGGSGRGSARTAQLAAAAQAGGYADMAVSRRISANTASDDDDDENKAESEITAANTEERDAASDMEESEQYDKDGEENYAEEGEAGEVDANEEEIETDQAEEDGEDPEDNPDGEAEEEVQIENAQTQREEEEKEEEEKEEEEKEEEEKEEEETAKAAADDATSEASNGDKKNEKADDDDDDDDDDATASSKKKKKVDDDDDAAASEKKADDDDAAASEKKADDDEAGDDDNTAERRDKKNDDDASAKKKKNDDDDDDKANGKKSKKKKKKKKADDDDDGDDDDDDDDDDDAVSNRQRLRQEKLKQQLATARMQKKRAAEQSENKATRGATKSMKAHTSGTEEFEERKKGIVKVIRKVAGKKRAIQVQKKLEQPVATQAPPFRKVISAPKFAERLPILKRIIRMGDEESMILDATLSFVQGLKYGIFRSPKALADKEKKALLDWLQLLHIALPQEWAIHVLIDDLIAKIDFVAQSDSNLEKVLSAHPTARNSWSASCMNGKPGTGFSCGFWKLLHILTVGLAQHKGGINLINADMVSPDSRTFAPAEAADVLREYMANFYPCSDCSQHFMYRYDDCSYHRCDRLNDEITTTTDDGWKAFSLWLWEFHNEVSVRILQERVASQKAKEQRANLLSPQQGPVTPSIEDEIQVLWPTLQECVTCYKADGKWDRHAVFLHLEKTYWPITGLDAKTARLLRFEDDIPSESGLTWLLVVIGSILACFMRQSLFSRTGLQQTILQAKKIRMQGGGSRKRSD